MDYIVQCERKDRRVLIYIMVCVCAVRRVVPKAVTPQDGTRSRSIPFTHNPIPTERGTIAYSFGLSSESGARVATPWISSTARLLPLS